MSTWPPKKLDDKGRCCGRKPIDYKGGWKTSTELPHKFCDRCDRAFDRVSGEQIENWAWKKQDDGSFRATCPDARWDGRLNKLVQETNGTSS